MKSEEVTKVWMLLQIVKDCIGFPEYANIAAQAREELLRVNDGPKKAEASKPAPAPTPAPRVVPQHDRGEPIERKV